MASDGYMIPFSWLPFCWFPSFIAFPKPIGGCFVFFAMKEALKSWCGWVSSWIPGNSMSSIKLWGSLERWAQVSPKNDPLFLAFKIRNAWSIALRTLKNLLLDLRTRNNELAHHHFKVGKWTIQNQCCYGRISMSMPQDDRKWSRKFTNSKARRGEPCSVENASASLGNPKKLQNSRVFCWGVHSFSTSL